MRRLARGSIRRSDGLGIQKGAPLDTGTYPKPNHAGSTIDRHARLPELSDLPLGRGGEGVALEPNPKKWSPIAAAPQVVGRGRIQGANVAQSVMLQIQPIEIVQASKRR